MTRDEWIKRRQLESSLSWQEIERSGWDAVRCTCGKNGCLGWRLDKVDKPLNQGAPEEGFELPGAA